jgi:hypothetical protein
MKCGTACDKCVKNHIISAVKKGAHSYSLFIGTGLYVMMHVCYTSESPDQILKKFYIREYTCSK